MRQFYLSRNNHGYYRVVFVDPVTGAQSVGKSTGTKDKVEATMIATTWLNGGVPSGRTGTRAFLNSDKISATKNLQSIVQALTEAEALKLVEMISRKFNFQTPCFSTSVSAAVPKVSESVIPEPVVAEPALAVKTVLSESSVPVNPVSSVTSESKPKRRIVVIKKAGARTSSKELPPPPVASVSVLKNEGGKIPLCAFLDNFWDYDNSPFIERTLAYGHSISRKHAYNQRSFVRNYWRPYWGDDTCIEDLTKPELDDFFYYLYREVGLKGETVNKIINSCSRATRWLLDNKRIKENPMLGVERFKAEHLDRGIPTEQEVRELLNVDWENPTAFLAFKLGAFCGLRAGEISGLRVCDIDVVSDIIHVRHSFSETDGLKSTKNKDTRDLPIDHQTILQLMSHARTNPEYGDMSFIFYQPQNPKKAYYPGYYNDIFYIALDKIGIHEAERKDRNIVFHSLRHFCATILAQRTDLKTVQSILGHRTMAMSAHYSDHETQEKFNNVRTIMSDAWEKLLSA